MIFPQNKWILASLIWFIASIYALIFRDTPGHSTPPFPHFDKLAHGLLFFAQIWLLAKAYLVASRPIPVRTLLAFALVYAISSETAQSLFTQTRQGDPLDALADIIGASIALIFAYRLYEQRRMK